MKLTQAHIWTINGSLMVLYVALCAATQQWAGLFPSLVAAIASFVIAKGTKS